MDPRGVVRSARQGFWHLRKGGPRQVAQWWRRRGRPVLAVSAVENVLGKAVMLDEPPPWRLRAGRPVVAAILDDFSAQAWGEVFDLVLVDPVSWREDFENHEFEMLFVESAWHGNEDRWQYMLTGSRAPSQPLRDMVSWCRQQGIPTVFWNKEDPPHFEDFIESAALFDRVFTTDANMIAHYRHRLGHDRVGVLPFAAAEHLHNPARLRRGHQEKDVAFAGTYFAHKFPERRAQMDLLLGGALDVSPRLPDSGLEIFSRFEHLDERYRFPGKLADRVVGSLAYADMLVAYKAFKVFLNVNSVTDSPSMCARRIFEILATGTPVVTTWSAAVRNFFGDDELPIVHSREEAAWVIRGLCQSKELRDRTVHKAQRTIWEQHTYRHRAATVLNAVGKSTSWTFPSVTAVVATNRPLHVEDILRAIGQQSLNDVQVVVITHGFDIDAGKVRALQTSAGIADLRVATMDESVPLGACLRLGVGMAEGEIIAKMDDDDAYGRHYLRDLVHALRYSGAAIVGKQAHYMYLEGMDALMLRFGHREHRWTDMVMGPTITGWADVFREHPFGDLACGEDTDFLRRVGAAGGGIYSADRFNFVQRRSTSHTWDVDDVELLSTGEVYTFGDSFAHVMF